MDIACPGTGFGNLPQAFAGVRIEIGAGAGGWP